METEELSIDTQHLKRVLDNLSWQLECCFESRQDTSSSRKSPEVLDEDLADREKDLFAAVQIAKALLKRNKKLTKELNNLKDSCEKHRRYVTDLKSENQSLSIQLKRANDKNENIRHMLSKTEVENRNLLKEINTSKQSSQNSTKASWSLENKVESMELEFRAQINYLKNQNCTLEKENLLLTQENTQLSNFNSELSQIINELKSEKQSLLEKYTGLTHKLEETLRTKQVTCQELLESKKVSKALEQQVSDLKQEINELQQPKQTLKYQSQRPPSLKAELKSLETSEDEVPSPEPPEFTSLKLNPCELTTSTFEVARANFKTKKTFQVRKSPCEEFFVLTTQAIKLNSKYIDTICTVDPYKLYLKALKLNIPFHRWHSWIKSKLYSYYIKRLCKEQPFQSFEILDNLNTI